MLEEKDPKFQNKDFVVVEKKKKGKKARGAKADKA